MKDENSFMKLFLDWVFLWEWCEKIFLVGSLSVFLELDLLCFNSDLVKSFGFWKISLKTRLRVFEGDF